MAARDDDMMRVSFEVLYPKWFDELTMEEFDNVIRDAQKKAIQRFEDELHKAELFWRLRKEAQLSGQTDIYDYV